MPAPTKQTDSSGVKRMVLGLDLDTWNNVRVATLLVAAAFGVGSGIATYVVMRMQKEAAAAAAVAAADAATAFERYKVGVAAQVAEAKKEGLDAGKTASDALGKAAAAELETAKTQERAARLEAEAEKTRNDNLALQTKLEVERAARLKLEGKIAWRNLSPTDKSELTAALKPFPKQKCSIESLWGDSEAKAYARQFADVFKAVGWECSILDSMLDTTRPGVQMVIHEAGEKRGTTTAGGMALMEALKKLSIINLPFQSPRQAEDEVRLLVNRKP